MSNRKYKQTQQERKSKKQLKNKQNCFLDDARKLASYENRRRGYPVYYKYTVGLNAVLLFAPWVLLFGLGALA
jgi:hypothetical protein